MWKKLQDTPPFYLQFVHTNTYEISITDYVTLYSVNFSENEFIDLLKESNPALEITNNDLLHKGKDMILNTEEVNELSLSRTDKYLKLYIYKSYGYPLKLKLNLKEVSKEIFFEKVTQPLLITIKELRTIEKELRSSLKEKDVEIKTYKEEGGKILGYRKTATFDEKEHLKKHEVYQVNGVYDEFPTNLLKKKEDVKTNDFKLKQEITDVHEKPIKQEPMTLDEPNTSLIIPKSEIKQEVKNESQNSCFSSMKRRKNKLNL